MPKPKYCWDSCVLIAHLTGENRPEDELEGLHEIVDLIDRRQAILITSAQAMSEVLTGPADPSLQGRLDALFRRPSCVMVDLNRVVLSKAGAIRQAVRNAGGRIEAPDAHFIATAVLHGVDALHTFDDRLLRLSGDQAVEGLRISKPRGDQMLLSLPLG